MNRPILSIIIPTYNRAPVLPKAIASVFAQQCADIEIIVVDDGSTDNTYVQLKPWIDEGKIIYYTQVNQGVSAARNLGVSNASGEYLVFLDSDDEMTGNYMAEVFSHIYENPDIIFLSAQIFVDQVLVKNVLATRPYGKPLDIGLFLAGTFIVKRSLFLASGGYDTEIKHSENNELSLRLRPLLKKKIFIDKYLLRINQVKNDRISNSPVYLIDSITYILNKHNDYYQTHTDIKWIYLNILGVAYLKRKDRQAARKYFIEAIQLKPFGLKSYLYFFYSYM